MELWSENSPRHGVIHRWRDGFAVKPGQAYPQDSINEFTIGKLNSLVNVDFRFILFIVACVMSREFTRHYDISTASVSLNLMYKCNFIHSKIFNLTKYREVLVKYSLLIRHAGMLI